MIKRLVLLFPGVLLLASVLLAGGELGHPPTARALDYDCTDFATQAEAQEYLLLI